jgi:putative phosphoesterase
MCGSTRRDTEKRIFFWTNLVMKLCFQKHLVPQLISYCPGHYVFKINYFRSNDCMKTIGVISDTHIPTRQTKLPEEVLFAFKGVDLILHAGDFESLTVADTLEEIAPLEAVSGNMCWREVMEKFPQQLTLNVEGLSIGLTHGSGGPYGYNSRVIQLFAENKPDIIVSGHTHMPNAEIVNGILLLNPGSPLDKRFAKENSVLILQIENSSYKYNFISIS